MSSSVIESFEFTWETWLLVGTRGVHPTRKSENPTRPNPKYKGWVGVCWIPGLGWVHVFLTRSNLGWVRVPKENDWVNPVQSENIKKKKKRN